MSLKAVGFGNNLCCKSDPEINVSVTIECISLNDTGMQRRREIMNGIDIECSPNSNDAEYRTNGVEIYSHVLR